jgi:hypothetical integral membrane protein (TIGR02206 family)
MLWTAAAFLNLTRAPAFLAEAAGFHAFTALHLWAVLGSAAFIIAASTLGRKLQNGVGEPQLRRALGWLCVAIYVVYQAWLWLPRNFSWPESLPLEFCDMSLLVAAGVLLLRTRWLRGLLYFWAVVFTVQAFITPVLQKGPSSPAFWLFWSSHASIANAAVYDLVVGKFRPTLADGVRSYVISFFYAAFLLVLDNLTGWDYGYVGPFKPATPTLLDALGDYPLRVVWMMLIAAAGFFIAWLPWAWVKRERDADT